MQETILAVFSHPDHAENAIIDLKNAGYAAKDFSVITRDNPELTTVTQSTGATVASGVASGATTGGAMGALAGLLIGIGAITVPGVGALLIGGPLIAALGLSGAAAVTASGALTGALAGGLMGGLVGLGVPESTAQIYENHLKAGGVLLAVPTNSRSDADARRILQNQGAEEITTVASSAATLSTPEVHRTRVR